jgi:hypothetical protein
MKPWPWPEADDVLPCACSNPPWDGCTRQEQHKCSEETEKALIEDGWERHEKHGWVHPNQPDYHLL